MSNAKTLTRNDIIAAIAFWSLILLLFLFFNKMARLEPIEGDGWFAASGLKRHDWSTKEIFRTLYYYHKNGNPRIGIFFWLLSYHPLPIHQLMTPSAIVLFFISIFTVALGRWPHPTDARDSYLLLVIAALCWLVTPYVGQTFFYRPITTNYVFGFLCTIAFFIPFRFYRASSFGTGRFWWVFAVIMTLCGIFVGLCNEHTGPMAILVSAGFTVLALKRKRIRQFAWMFGGSAGLIGGYLLLFFAPGQKKRYGGIGDTSLLEILTRRGWTGNLEVVWAFIKDVDVLFVFLCALLLLSVLLNDKTVNRRLAAQRFRYAEAAAFVFFSVSVLLISLVSPRGFWRLTLASVFLLLMATLIIVDVFSVNRKLIAGISLLAIIVNIWFAHRSITLYTGINQAFQDRIERMKNTGPEDDVYLPVYPYPRSPMYWGDVLAKPNSNPVKAMTRYFGVRSIKKLE